MAWIKTPEPEASGELHEAYERTLAAAAVTGYFNFVNRLALGLGVELEE